MTISLRRFLIGAGLALLAGCSTSGDSDPVNPGGGGGGGGGGGNTTPTSVVLTPTSLTLTGAGSTGTVQAAVSSSSGPITSPTVSWTSSAPAVATVSGSGTQATIIAVAPGTSTITATSGSVSSQATVTVVLPTHAVTVSFTGTGRGRITSVPGGIDCANGATTGCTASYAQGTSVTLTATAQSGSAFDGWQGACSGTGTCVFTADAARAVQAGFRELPKPVATVAVTPDSVVMSPNGTAQLVATTRAADGSTLTGRTITWSSSNETVVTVSATGLVTARGIGGPVEVRATSEGITGVARVSVRSPFVTAVKLGVGWGHACAIEAGGALYCWGSNRDGRLGLGTVTSTILGATRIAPGTEWADVDAGYDHTCAKSSVGVLYCWGNNEYGQVGDGTTITRPNPTVVSGGVAAAQILIGASSSCTLGGGGLMHCWGYNSNGYLATGTAVRAVMTPAPAAGGIAFASVNHTGQTSCGLTASGVAWCWGGDSYGRNGDSTWNNRTAPTRVSGGRTFRSIGTSNSSSGHSCAIDMTGAAWCWGNASYGRLGDGTNNYRTYPGVVVTSQRFSSIAVGEYHSCALTAEGQA